MKFGQVPPTPKKYYYFEKSVVLNNIKIGKRRKKKGLEAGCGSMQEKSSEDLRSIFKSTFC